MTCANCEQLDSEIHRDLCSRCYWALPYDTRKAYDRRGRGRLSTKQVVHCLREKYASVKAFGGGSRRGL